MREIKEQAEMLGLAVAGLGIACVALTVEAAALVGTALIVAYEKADRWARHQVEEAFGDGDLS